MAERALKDAFAVDVRPFLAEYRASRGLPADPLDAFRQSGYLARISAERGPRKSKAVGSYA
jgi:L-rhamnose isomerase/sugar isomerase